MNFLHIITNTHKIVTALCTFIFVVSTGYVAAETTPQWVSLSNNEMIGWCENENWLYNYLINNELTAQEIEKYRAEKLIAKSWGLNVYASPSKKGKIVGKIIITADPGKGLNTFYQNAGSSHRIGFEPDEFDVDWGYGPPYFHQTALKQIGSWFLLPRNPMPTAGWIDINQISRKTKDSYGNDIPYNILNIESETVYTFENKSIVIINIDKKGFLVRPEQPADMWCDEGDAPPLQETIPIKLKYSDIYDKDGHLKLHLKYKRGC